MFPIFILKVLIFFLRTFTSNSATALPGLILEERFPNTLRKFLSQFDKVVFVTGTNGKTTTSRIISHLLEQNNISYVSNKSGSNLIRGIASELLDKSNLFGKVSADIAVFEVEEATMPRLTKFVKANTIIVTNIFRDQLDAYGEIDKTYQYISDAVKKSDNPSLILNIDDHRVASLAKLTSNSVKYIGFDEEYKSLIKFENKESFNHGGTGKENPYIISNITINDDLETEFDILQKNKVVSRLKTLVPGYHNTYNAAAGLLGFANITDENKIFSHLNSYNLSLEKFKPVFGRGEIITYKNTKFQLLLGKNPAGLNLNLNLLKHVKKREALLLLLNDNTADGKDVSWIWDTDFSILKDLKFENIFVSGTRKYDIALRLKHEGIKVYGDNQEDPEGIFTSIPEAIESLSSIGFEKVYVLPTYTAMLELRKELSKRTEVKDMWK